MNFIVFQPFDKSRFSNYQFLRKNLDKTYNYWGKTVCGRCTGNSSILRCRPHLIESLSKGSIKRLSFHGNLVDYIACHIKYMLSFRWENRGTETVEDMAALISAVGWCIEIIIQAIEKAGYRPGEDIAIAIDSSASSFVTDKKGHYDLKWSRGGTKTSSDLIDMVLRKRLQILR